jgi:hypothetical protein
MRFHALFTIAVVVACGGCSDEAVSVPGGPSASLACAAAEIEACRVNQKACELTEAGSSCVACDEASYAAPDGSCQQISGTSTSHDFQEFTVQPGQEVLGLCQSWTMNNPTELWVHAVELVQDQASHHSNWTYVPDDMFEGPDGLWPCDDRGYSQLSAALSGGVLYAQSTQAAKEVQKFPQGAAIRIPPYARVIGDVHLLNTSSEPVTGHARLNVYSVPAEEVVVKLAPFHLTYDGLDIPPHSTSRFIGECALGESFDNAADVPFELSVYYALPHTHALGTRFFFEVLGGPDDGKSIIDVADFNSEARGRAYDPPVPVVGAQGLRFGCEFVNPRDESVGWGFGDQEMCEMLGFADSRVVFESVVDEAVAVGQDGETLLFTGPCATLAVPWSHDKPGGSAP